MSESMLSWAKEPKNKKFVGIAMIVVVLLIGWLIIKPFDNTPQNTPKVQTVVKASGGNGDYDNYEDKLERKLKTILSKMEGVGSVDVMITTMSTEEKVLAQNTKVSSQQTDQKDQTGGTRLTTQAQNDSDIVMQNGKVPYVTKENSPEIKGVFILAEGADDSNVKAQITDAVSKLLDVPVHKISVEKKKN